MKLLIIGNGSIGKIENKYYINKHTANFCEELSQKNMKVSFLQFKNIIKENEGLQDCPLSDNIKIEAISSTTSGRFKKILSYLFMSFLIIKNIIKNDFVYIFYPGHISTIAGLLCILLKKDYALYVRGEYKLNSKIDSRIIKKAKFCLTVSDLIKNNLEKNNDNVSVIAPMIDFSKKDILQTKEQKNKNFKFLFVGRIEYNKGIFELIEAIKDINKTHTNLEFEIVGGGEDYNTIKNLSENIENLTLLGQIAEKEKLLSIYREADIFIFPSHFEGFPRVLYEAMMARLPIITTLVGGIPGLMKDSYNCVKIEPKNSKSIVNAINRIINDNKLREDIVNQATKDMNILFNGNKKQHSILIIEKMKETNVYR